MWKGGIGDRAYVAIRRVMKEFKVALKLSLNFQLTRLALADCYFCCPNSFDLNPFDAAILYKRINQIFNLTHKIINGKT